MSALEHIGSPSESIFPTRPVLSTKLYPPRFRSNLIQREALIDRIGSAGDQQIVIIEAPAGYGKSTLVGQWMKSARIPVAWVSLDLSDNDPMNFLSLVISSLQLIDPDIGANARLILQSQGMADELIVVHALIEELATSTRPFALVLDDYHLIESTTIHRVMGAFLRHLPHAMRIFILSRTSPGIPLSRHRGRGELLELDHEDLRFTSREAVSLMHLVDGADLTPGEIAVLNDRAEGWPAGLQLVSHLVRGQSRSRIENLVNEFSGGLEPIDSYLWEEVLNSLPQQSLDFLLRSSIFDHFTAELCDFVSGRTDSEQIIRELERAHLFVIPLDDAGLWHRYHYLFRDVLRDRFAEIAGEGESEHLHRRAAIWLEQNGRIDDAARHAVAGADWELAGRLLGHVAADLYVADNVTSLHVRLAGLPAAVFESNPELSFLLAWALIRSGKAKDSVAPLRLAEETWIAQDDQRNLGRVAIVRGLLSMFGSNYKQASEHYERAAALLPEEDHTERATAFVFLGAAYLRFGNPELVESALRRTTVMQLDRSPWIRASETAVHAQMLVLRGLLREAAILYRRTLKSEGHIKSMQIQQAFALMSVISIEWGDIDEAEQMLQHGLRLAEEAGTSFWNGRYHYGLAQVAWHRGETELAFDEIERSIANMESMGSLHESRLARAMQARLWLDSHQLALARRWADRNELDPFWEQAYDRYFEQTTHIRLMLAEGDRVDAAIPLLNRLLAEATERGRIGDAIELNMLISIALRMTGKPTESLSMLERALELAEPNGYLKLFTNQGDALAPQLRNLSVRGANRDYARHLLTIIEGKSAQQPVRQSGLIESLSEREIEVLRLVGAGLPNRAIGERLFITELTVKKHISNILGKLQTTNRTQAVDQARRMGLLSE